MSSSSSSPSTPHVVPLEIVSHKPYVKVSANGAPAGWFVIDSGASRDCIASRYAECFACLPGHRHQIALAGRDQPLELPELDQVELSVNGKSWMDRHALLVPLERAAQFDGHPLDGILGHSFFEQFLVQLDYPRRQLRLYPPDHVLPADALDGGESRALLAIEFRHGVPVVRARIQIDGHPAFDVSLAVDTGARLPLVLNRPFVERNGLCQPGTRLYAGTVGGGIGGNSQGLVGRITQLELGEVSVGGPITVFSRDQGGVFGSPDYDGFLGGQLLCHWVVTLDFARGQLQLAAAQSANHPDCLQPDQYDSSGLFLSGEGSHLDHFRVVSVAPESPASDAGIEPGDELVPLGMGDHSQLDLEHLRALLTLQGVEYRFEVRRGYRRLRKHLVTRRLV